MIPITFLSVPAFLLDNPPDWVSALQLRAEIPAYSETGLTLRDTRTPLGDTLRLSLNFYTVLQDDEVPQFRNSLQSLTTEKILCPLWCAPIPPSATPAVTTSHYYRPSDGSIHPAADLPIADLLYPILIGRFDGDPPDPIMVRDGLATATINFIEDDAHSATLPTFTAPAGIADGRGSTRPLCPFRPDWSTSPKSGKSETQVDRRQIGQLRDQQTGYFAQPSFRTVQQSFLLQDDEPWQFLRFFLDLRGGVENFWLPAAISDLTLTGDVVSSDTRLDVTDPTLTAVGCRLILDDLVGRKIVTVSALHTTYVSLSGAVGRNFSRASTRVESLFLARFKAKTVTLAFLGPTPAQAKVDFEEVPWEASTAPAGETIGTTMGPAPESAYLYEFTVAYPGATQTWRYTDFERDLTIAGHTFTSAPLSHESVHETDQLMRQECNLVSRMFTGNPLQMLLPFSLEWPLMLDVWEVEVSGSAATNARRIFAGEVCEATDSEPPFLKAIARSMSHLFDRKFPRLVFQPGCNLQIFEPKCGLLKTNWEWTGLVTAYNPATRELALGTVSRVTGSAIVPIPIHFFAGGEIYFGSGTTQQFRTVADSAAGSGTNVVIVLGSSFTTAPAVGATMTMHPGCDGRYLQTCIARFANGPKFLGFPFMPLASPSATKVDHPNSSGGKK